MSFLVRLCWLLVSLCHDRGDSLIILPVGNLSSAQSECSIPFSGEETSLLLDLMKQKNLTEIGLNIIKKRLVQPKSIHNDTLDPELLSALSGSLKSPGHECGYLISRDNSVNIRTCHGQNYGALCEVKGCPKCEQSFPRSMCTQNQQSCILAFCGVQSWYEGRTWCQRLGGDLYVPDKDLPRLFGDIWAHFKDCYRFWIGVSRFQWITGGSVVIKFDWLNDEPMHDQECVSYHVGDGQSGWQAVNCSQEMPLFCSSGGNEEMTSKATMPDESTERNIQLQSYNESMDANIGNRNMMYAAVVGWILLGIVTIILIIIIVYYKKKAMRKKRKYEKLAMREPDGDDNVHGGRYIAEVTCVERQLMERRDSHGSTSSLDKEDPPLQFLYKTNDEDVPIKIKQRLYHPKLPIEPGKETKRIIPITVELEIERDTICEEGGEKYAMGPEDVIVCSIRNSKKQKTLGNLFCYPCDKEYIHFKMDVDYPDGPATFKFTAKLAIPTNDGQEISLSILDLLIELKRIRHKSSGPASLSKFRS